MTVATTNITSGPYTGAGTGDEFSYDFRLEDKSQVSVWETTDLGVKTLLTVDTDYTVAGIGVDGGGIITRVAGNLPTDYIWYIRSNYADTQSTGFGSQGGFFPDVHEAAFDKRTLVSQQKEDEFNRAVKLDISDESAESTDMTIPIVSTRASQYLGFDASGNLITIAGTAGAVSVSSFMETLLDDNDIETALGTLGLSKGADAASAASLILGVGNYFNVTGTDAITSIATKFIGAQALLHFDGILTFTHHATDLILPGGVNITTAAGDHALIEEYDTGEIRCVGYFRANGFPVNLTNMPLVTPTLTSPTLLIPVIADFTNANHDHTDAAGGGTVPSASGSMVQEVNVQDGAVATGTTLIPNDNSIPQSNEGDEYMTLAITPTSATNKLKIEVVANLAHSTSTTSLFGALFQDATADAIAAAVAAKGAANDVYANVNFTHYMVAGTTSSTTFKVRLGTSAAGTTTFNGAGGGIIFGGVMASSITITEIAV